MSRWTTERERCMAHTKCGTIFKKGSRETHEEDKREMGKRGKRKKEITIQKKWLLLLCGNLTSVRQCET